MCCVLVGLSTTICMQLQFFNKNKPCGFLKISIYSLNVVSFLSSEWVCLCIDNKMDKT